MNIIFTVKKYMKVSITIFMVMLTFVFSGCNKSSDNINIADKSVDDAQNYVNQDLTVPNDDKYEFDADVVLEGGTGKAKIENAHIVSDDGILTATITWSSDKYDYMIVDGEKYSPINESGNSVFEFRISALNEKIAVIADTTAMSKPHEIEYNITFIEKDSNESHLLDTKSDIISNENISDLGESISDFGTLSSAAASFIDGLEIVSELKPQYAERFRVLYTENFIVIIINNMYCYVMGEDIERFSDNIPNEVTVLKGPLEKIYVAGTGSMDYFVTLDVLSAVKFSSIDSKEWNLDKVSQEMEEGNIVYAGKYSAPDYERLVGDGCDLAVLNTMISHSPETLDMLDNLSIPYIIDYSSYESNPLGRMEWIKLYGELMGKAQAAKECFDENASIISSGFEQKGLSVGYFYINNSGGIVVRRNQDYVAKMIEYAGGTYCLNDDSSYDGSGTMNVQAESFYGKVNECDYLIYNTTIVGEINSIKDITDKCSVLANTKAFKDGNVFTIDKDFYQSPMNIAEYIEDINAMLNGRDCKFLKRLK